MRKYFLFLFIVLIGLCTQAQEVNILKDTIPFRNDLGLIIIPISFNGVEKQFAFDTGAQRSVAFSWATQELKKTSKSIKVRSSNDSRTSMRLYKSGVIQLGSKKITKHRILQVRDSNIFSCHGIDGILGVDITKHFNWKIDYQHQYLVMYEKDFFPVYTKQMNELDFEFKSDRPYVYGTVNDSKIKFLLDTGASDSDLKKKTYNITDLGNIPNRKLNSGFYDVNGTLTPTTSTMIQFPQLISGEVNLTPVLEYGTSSTKIGNSLWEDKSIFLSLDSQKLFFEERTVKEETLGYDFGVAFDKGILKVVTIFEGSEAWEAGLRQGDVITTINGRTFSNFCEFSEYHRGQISSGNPYTITYGDGEQLSIRKRELFSKIEE